MWIMLLLLWSIPLTLGFMALMRTAHGKPAMVENESRLFFGAGRNTRLTVLMVVEFTVLAVTFFIVGLIQGAALLNFGMVWIAPAMLLTAVGAIVLLAFWVRLGPGESRKSRHAGWHRNVDLVLRKLAGYRNHFDMTKILGTNVHRRAKSIKSPAAARKHEF